MGIGTLSSDIIQLTELGLVLPLEVDKKQTIDNVEIGESLEIHLKGYDIKLKKIRGEVNNKFILPGYALTQEGMDVYNLIQDRLTEEEAQKYLEFFRGIYKEQYEVTLEKL